jgi:hypothetical protein
MVPPSKYELSHYDCALKRDYETVTGQNAGNNSMTQTLEQLDRKKMSGEVPTSALINLHKQTQVGT